MRIPQRRAGRSIDRHRQAGAHLHVVAGFDQHRIGLSKMNASKMNPSCRATLKASGEDTGHDRYFADVQAIMEVRAAAVLAIADAKGVCAWFLYRVAKQAVATLGQHSTAQVAEFQQRIEF